METREVAVSTGKRGKARGMEQVVLVSRKTWDKDDKGRFIHPGESRTLHRKVSKGEEK